MCVQFTGNFGDLYNPKVSSDSVIDMHVANADLSNLSSDGLQNVGGLMFPSNKYIDITRVKQDNIKYTAPEDGWFYVRDSIYGVDSNGTTLVNLTLGTFAATSQLTAYRYYIGNQGCFIPCRKGDKVIIGFYRRSDTMITRFYYAGGH